MNFTAFIESVVLAATGRPAVPDTVLRGQEVTDLVSEITKDLLCLYGMARITDRTVNVGPTEYLRSMAAKIPTYYEVELDMSPDPVFMRRFGWLVENATDDGLGLLAGSISLRLGEIAENSLGWMLRGGKVDLNLLLEEFMGNSVKEIDDLLESIYP